MRKILVSMAAALAVVMAMAVAVPVSAASDGSVTADLVEVGTGPDWNVVGSLVLNTTASGSLIVDVNVDTEPNLEDYDIVVLVYYQPPPPPPAPADEVGIFEDVLSSNAQGQSNTRVSVDIDPPPVNDRVWVVVNVLEQSTSPPTPPEYLNMPPPIVVPLKQQASNGSVKSSLVEVATGPNWNVVGSLLLNTTPGGKLNVKVNIDTEPNLQDYDIVVSVFYSGPPPPPTPLEPPDLFRVFPGVIDTNAQGQGNAKVSLDISPPSTSDSIWVIVNVRERPSPPPPSPFVQPEYHNLPPPVEVPLK